MRRTLYLKFIIAYLIFGFLSFVTIATFNSDYIMQYLIEEKADALYKEATLVANRYAANFYKKDTSLEYIQSTLEAVDTYITAPIWVLNASGKIVLSSRNRTVNDENLVIDRFDPTSTEGKYYTTGNFYGQFDTEMLSVFSPITSNYKVKGYVVIHTSLEGIEQVRNQILNISYITLGIIFLLSLIIMGVFTKMVYIPIIKITHAANEYAKGNLKYELPIHKNDEIGYLSASLNFMSNELSRSEENQKKFIANVSHDFRSPLTSIKGYLEAILDGTIPVEMQEKYLKIVVLETERLNKLTSSLLTLNDFGSKGIILEKTDFDINKVIKDTAATFEGTCKNKKISIELILTGKTLYVSADMGKIQQVLYNLIDNAIKFSHNNSKIFLETTEKGEKVFVSVKDTGIGIPKGSLKLIWDRFYKTDVSRGKDKKGIGLGLCIVKEIVQAHGETINVISTEGVGTEFIFRLPKSKIEE